MWSEDVRHVVATLAAARLDPILVGVAVCCVCGTLEHLIPAFTGVSHGMCETCLETRYPEETE